MEKYPMKMAPAGKDYLWGGEKLYGEYHKTGDLHPLAESWELSCHKDGECVIANGRYKGEKLSAYVEGDRASILGAHGAAFAEFPVLIKLIDAQKPLSVQVHPDDEYALRVEKEYGKTEMWVVLEAEKGAQLLFGLNRDLEKEEFRRRIEDGTLTEVTNAVEVAPGDVFFVEPGTLHAIGAGILIAEIQQNSNTTYRVYDYGRLGADGKPRALHIEKAMEVTDLCRKELPKREKESAARDGYTETGLAACKYFTVARLDIETQALLSCGEESFVSLLCIGGKGEILLEGHSYPLQKGDSYFLPAGLGSFCLRGELSVLRTTV